MLIPQLLAVVLLVLVNGFFVAAEFALVKIRDTQLPTLANKGHRGARSALEIVGKLDSALSATQLGITIASLGLGWLGKPAFASLLAPLIKYLNVGPEEADWIAFGIGFTVITFLAHRRRRASSEIAGDSKIQPRSEIDTAKKKLEPARSKHKITRPRGARTAMSENCCMTGNKP